MLFVPDLSTLYEWCETERELDRTYGTDRQSPLHHDQRCTIHSRPWPATIRPPYPWEV